MRILITGTAGFIGFHMARRLVSDGHLVVGYDGITDYYDVRLKRARLAELEGTNGFRSHVGMLEDMESLTKAADDCQPEIIIHLAAQAGVRYSLEHPESYVSSNLVGTFNVMELARLCQPRHFLLASTSSVYGGNDEMPFSESHKADHPLTIYAATKKANEVMSHSYAHLWRIPTTCFRFFTVYGPWGRPDMVPFKFVDAIERGETIDVYGQGQMQRDFTYIDDLIEGLVRLLGAVPEQGKPIEAEGVTDSLSAVAPWRVINIAGGRPVELMRFIEAIETSLGIAAKKNFLPMQKGDVTSTHADASLLQALTDFVPRVPAEEGVRRFVDWYRSYRARAGRSD